MSRKCAYSKAPEENSQAYSQCHHGSVSRKLTLVPFCLKYSVFDICFQSIGPTEYKATRNISGFKYI